MIFSRFTEDQPTFEELRRDILSTPGEDPRLCYTVYPDSIDKKFDKEEVGEPLYLTPYIDEGERLMYQKSFDADEGSRFKYVHRI